jgi:hypothetical protein
MARNGSTFLGVLVASTLMGVVAAQDVKPSVATLAVKPLKVDVESPKTSLPLGEKATYDLVY